MTIVLLLAAALAQGGSRVYPEEVTKALVGRKVTIEGKVTSRTLNDSGQILSLRGARNVRLLLNRGPVPEEAEFEGTVQAAGDSFLVVVTSFKGLAKEGERFETFADAAKDNPDAWFALERWAERRHKLLGSEAMGEKKLEAYAKGLAALRQRAANDPAALLALRSRIVKDDKLPKFDFADLDHGIARAEFDGVKKDDPAALEKFRKSLEQRLPDAASSQANFPAPLVVKYAAAPLDAFRINKLDRDVFARHWRNEVLGMELAAKRAQGAPPYDLALDAKRLAPDAPALASKWFKEYAAAQMARLPELTSGAAGKLAELVDAELNEPGDARKVRTEWLDVHTAALRRKEADTLRAAQENGREAARDPAPWFELAQIRQAWFPKDAAENDTAKFVLLDIAKFAPDFAPLEKALPPFGYSRRPNGTWLPHAAPDPVDPKRAVVRADGVANGMRVEEVAGLMGAPKKSVRIATRGALLLHWLYETPDGEVRITFKGLPDQPRVAKVSTVGKGDAAP